MGIIIKQDSTLGWEDATGAVKDLLCTTAQYPVSDALLYALSLAIIAQLSQRSRKYHARLIFTVQVQWESDSLSSSKVTLSTPHTWVVFGQRWGLIPLERHFNLTYKKLLYAVFIQELGTSVWRVRGGGLLITWWDFEMQPVKTLNSQLSLCLRYHDSAHTAFLHSDVKLLALVVLLLFACETLLSYFSRNPVTTFGTPCVM